MFSQTFMVVSNQRNNILNSKPPLSPNRRGSDYNGVFNFNIVDFGYASLLVSQSRQRPSVFSAHPQSMIASPASALAPNITGTSTRSF